MASLEEVTFAMTEYMARSHEEHLRLKSKIEVLSREIETLKAAQNPEESSKGSATNDEESAIASYQKFMSDYIVKAQLEKNKAVKNAESEVAKKYEEKIDQLTSALNAAKWFPHSKEARAADLLSMETAIFARGYWI